MRRAKIPVSVVIMTKNEEENISKCLTSVSAFAEVFVVDSISKDRTCDIAEEHGAKVVNFRWNGKYPKKKQWCLENLPFSHEWVLYVDADEEVRPELADEIAGSIGREHRHAGYFVGYDYVFLGQVLKHGHRVYKLVLLSRQKAKFVDFDDLEVANMWEVEGHYQPKIAGTVGILKNRMIHNDHSSLFHYFDRHNRYSDWEALLLKKRRYGGAEETQTWIRSASKSVFAHMPLKGAVAFFHSYLFNLGFLDGRAGFHYALARAFYYWQIGIKRSSIGDVGK